ncbi:unnamed protein product [Owenia fusiformis]|uniref:Epoxide hydrolase n=1 Tax=Owenia fusiformis TaxID=6347 RepID=A0A8S4Q348_OWEFU|nr:unnamed protein product [Owenia fusiformis]
MGALKVAAALALVSILLGYYFLKDQDVEPPKMADQWWGKGATPKDDSKEIIKFEIRVNATEIDELRRRLKNTRYFEVLEDVKSFQYGFHVTYMKQVVKYWTESYLPHWAKHEAHLNKFPHFKTMIGGIMVHYIHIKPKLKTGQTSVPLVLIHGWPGSVYEFYRAIDLFTDQRSDTVFEIICPSIPGFGWSEAPHRAGFDPVATARVFLRLMDRLKLNRFYVQGGDWGYSVAKYMALLQPTKILGLHMSWVVYQFPSSPTLGGIVRQLMAEVFPGLFVKPEDYWKVVNTAEKLKFLVQESGYFHLHATKPDTAGFGLTDSPVGLAAYILEKFSTWTNKDYRNAPDGNLEKDFSLDDLLTNVMIYWTTNTITSSMRYYKEFFEREENEKFNAKVKSVPTGLACYPNEIGGCAPKEFTDLIYLNTIHYSDAPKGGRFAAFEVPDYFVKDIETFVNKVETLKQQGTT